jgi:hypothetical protein
MMSHLDPDESGRVEVPRQMAEVKTHCNGIADRQDVPRLWS